MRSSPLISNYISPWNKLKSNEEICSFLEIQMFFNRLLLPRSGAMLLQGTTKELQDWKSTKQTLENSLINYVFNYDLFWILRKRKE